MTQSYNTVIDTYAGSQEVMRKEEETRFSCPTISFKLVSPEVVQVEVGWPVGGMWPQLARILDAIYRGDMDDMLMSALMKFAMTNPMEAMNASDLQIGFMRVFQNRDAVGKVVGGKANDQEELDDPCVDPEETIGHNLSFPSC